MPSPANHGKREPEVRREPAARPLDREPVVALTPAWGRQPPAGAAVPLIPDLQELCDLRCDLEAIALRRSAVLGDERWLAMVRTSAHDGQDALHAALASACDSRQLAATLEGLREEAAAYRDLIPGLPDRRADEADRAAGLIDAAGRKDAERLVELVVAQIRAEAARGASALVRAARLHLVGGHDGEG